MTDSERKSPKRAANDLSIVLQMTLGEDRFPVDVEEVAYEVSSHQDDPITKIKGIDIDDFEGMLRAGRRKPSWQILYSTASRYHGRERFTLAHEFGHYMLHRRPLRAEHYCDGELFEDCDFNCLPLQADQWKDAETEREEEADTFASFLLMPIDDYRNQVAGHEISRSLLRHVTNRYGVSLLAAVRKWIEFTELRAAMVVARDGFALWGRASGAAYKSGVFIRSGMRIPKRSFAALGPSAQSGNGNLPIPLPAGIWAFSRRSEPIRELTIFSERLGMSVSILLFEDEATLKKDGDWRPWDAYDQFLANDRR